MNNNMRAVVAALAAFVVVDIAGLAVLNSNRQKATRQDIQIVTPPPAATPAPTATPIPTPTINPIITDHAELTAKRNAISEDMEHTITIMEFEYIGDYFITAYCPEECGYRVFSDGTDNYPTGWITATGTTCHREEEWWKPSTCGINTAVNRYGDIFLIDGKVFIAEDTGPGAVGHWIDTFMPDYESMAGFGSHWTEVYAVNYIQSEPVKGRHFNIHDYTGKEFEYED